VRVDGAPYVLRSIGDQASGLETHTGLAVSHVERWLADDEGSLYAILPTGGAIVLDRDLPLLCEHLHDQHGASLLQLLEDRFDAPEAAMGDNTVLALAQSTIAPAPLSFTTQCEIPAQLGFITNPDPV
jgi:hypothetical protein